MITLALLVGGLVALVVGADLLVRGASRLALRLGLSPLVVGLTVVAFGTSAPEMAVSIGAALHGNDGLAVGNVVGSNIFNVLFILGLSALITPLAVHLQVVRQEVPIMLGASVMVLVMALDGRLGRAESLLLVALLIAYTVFLVVQARTVPAAAQEEYTQSFGPPGGNDWLSRLPVQLVLIAAGLALLVLGSGWLVDGAVVIARQLGVSDLVIGLTIVAAGTSLPEVATSVLAAIKGERDIAVGNVVGSNTFNLLGVLGLSGLAGAGLPVPAPALAFDLWVMVAVALACLPVFMTDREITRWEGALFLGYYAGYVAWLVLQAQGHAALPALGELMQSVVLPLTVVLLVVMMLRSGGRHSG